MPPCISMECQSDTYRSDTGGLKCRLIRQTGVSSTNKMKKKRSLINIFISISAKTNSWLCVDPRCRHKSSFEHQAEIKRDNREVMPVLDSFIISLALSRAPISLVQCYLCHLCVVWRWNVSQYIYRRPMRRRVKVMCHPENHHSPPTHTHTVATPSTKLWWIKMRPDKSGICQLSVFLCLCVHLSIIHFVQYTHTHAKLVLQHVFAVTVWGLNTHRGISSKRLARQTFYHTKTK